MYLLYSWSLCSNSSFDSKKSSSISSSASCFGRRAFDFKYVRLAAKTKYSDPRFKFSDINVCSERIPHCREYNLSTVFIDIYGNKGGEGYKECQKCEDHYYCIKENKGICEHIPDLTGYYDYGNDCKDACANEFTFVCVECVKERCQKCLTKHKTDNIHCVEGIQNCLAYDS